MNANFYFIIKKIKIPIFNFKISNILIIFIFLFFFILLFLPLLDRSPAIAKASDRPQANLVDLKQGLASLDLASRGYS